MTPEDRISNLISANIQAERELRQMQELHNKELAMMLDYFAKIGVTQQQIFEYLEIKSLAEIDKEKVFELRALANAIKEGTTTVAETFKQHTAESDKIATEARKKSEEARRKVEAATAKASQAETTAVEVDTETGEINNNENQK